MSQTLQQRQAQLTECQSHLDRYQRALNHFRAMQMLNVFSQEEVGPMCTLAGKILLGSWQYANQAEVLKIEIMELTPKPDKTEPTPKVKKGASSEDDSPKGH